MTPETGGENGYESARRLYILETMMGINFRKPALAAAASAAVLLAGCVAGSDGDGPSFKPGHYFLGGRFDSSYAYETYFVPLADHRFDWIEYGYNAATSAVCKVTRKSGAYRLADSSVSITLEAEAAPVIKCGFTKADFEAITPNPIKDPVAKTYSIRNRKDDAFEAEGFFGISTGFKSHPKRADPYGFYD